MKRDGYILYKGLETDGRIYLTWSEAQLHNDGTWRATIIQVEGI